LIGTAAPGRGAFDRTYDVVVHGGGLFALWSGAAGGTLQDPSQERWLADFQNRLATWH